MLERETHVGAEELDALGFGRLLRTDEQTQHLWRRKLGQCWRIDDEIQGARGLAATRCRHTDLVCGRSDAADLGMRSRFLGCAGRTAAYSCDVDAAAVGDEQPQRDGWRSLPSFHRCVLPG